MEKEIINFEALPVKVCLIDMKEGGEYRGLHSHVAVEIVKVKSGTLTITINGENLGIGENQIVFINSNVGHKLLSDNAKIIYIQLDVAFLKEESGYDEQTTLNEFVMHTKAKTYQIFSQNAEITEILKKITERYGKENLDDKWYMKSHLYELVAFMYCQDFLTPIAVSEREIKKIRPVVRYIEANFVSPLTLDEICSEVKCSKYSVCHSFKAATGATVFDYINYLRVQSAVEKLKQKENSVLEIASQCGFSSATYFNRVFKNVIGCSPSVYRRNFFNKI